MAHGALCLNALGEHAMAASTLLDTEAHLHSLLFSCLCTAQPFLLSR